MSQPGPLHAADPADRRPLLRFAGRRWSRPQLLAAADGLVDLLRARGLAPGAVLGIALPNLVAAATALLAGLRGGFTVAPVDPRQPVDRLLDWQRRLRPAALVTLDLATVYERTRPLLEDPALTLIVVAQMADELAPLPRLLSPWLRAGGTVRRLDDPRALVWDRAATASSAMTPGRVILPDGATLEAAALVEEAAPRVGQALLALPLATRPALRALFGAWKGGGTLVLSPRLDARGLAKAAKQSGVAERVE
jgi:acyl-CoA synthetase (AMP-forming)/AMP-acid ligase II